MIKTTCLILEKTDFTKDGNLKSQAFDSICQCAVVLHGTRVVKNRYASEIDTYPTEDPDPELSSPPKDLRMTESEKASLFPDSDDTP